MKSNTGSNRNITDDERRLLIFRAAELSARSENFAVASSFLTPSEQRIVFEALQKEGRTARLFFWGGFVGAERRMAIFLPVWIENGGVPPQGLFSPERERYFLSLLSEFGSEDLPGEFMTAVKIKKSGYEKLTHKDFLGALMALGIKRSVIGDIFCDGRDDFVFAENNCCEYIISELHRAGRDTVSCEKTVLPDGFSPVRNFEEICVTVASPRADGVVKALCRVSRETAAQMICGGLAEINYFPVTEVDRRVSAGDILSVRGYGKFIVDSSDETTSKGRIRVKVRKYI